MISTFKVGVAVNRESIFSLAGKRTLVVGAGGAIGLAICQGFVDGGAHVACLDISEEIAAGAVRSVQERGDPEAFPVTCDVRDPLEVQRAVSEVLDRFGSIDVLVNSAGNGILKPAIEFTLDDWEDTINVYLRSTFLFAKFVGKSMVERGQGSIINISSVASLVALGRGTAAYGAAKAGVNALTRELALEWAKKGVRVNAIAPCQIDTPQLRKLLVDPQFDPDKLMNAWLEAIPMGRIGLPQEIVGPCVFLASDASSLVTGHVLSVDGGYTIK
jgi:NAD(P)-dependent dehydrogenase (short-subunit alcohol dehydrogenase family)